MQYCLDTEFREDGRIIELISIGIVELQGDRTYYAVNSDFDESKCDEWLRTNVLAQLPPKSTWKSRAQIRHEVLEFCGKKPEAFWAYFADYDWVVLCQLFGRMIDLPQGWPMFCCDLKQRMVEHGIKKNQLPQASTEHDALADALWVKDCLLHIEAHY